MVYIEKRKSEFGFVERNLLNQIDDKIKMTLLNVSKSVLDLAVRKRGLNILERLTSPYARITKAQSEFPRKKARKFDNYLVAVLESSCWCFNFVMKDGNRTYNKACGYDH